MPAYELKTVRFVKENLHSLSCEEKQSKKNKEELDVYTILK
jgi:hypothetical protein